jgi:hypothetical protein
MAYLDYPAMVLSVIGDHGLFRLSCYGLFPSKDFQIIWLSYLTTVVIYHMITNYLCAF